MKYTNRANLPLPVAVWLARNEYDFIPKDRSISVTSLQDSVKAIALSKQLDLEESVDLHDLIDSRIGTAIHSAIEDSWNQGLTRELVYSLGYGDEFYQRLRINPEDHAWDEDINVYMELRSVKYLGDWMISGKFDFVMDGRVYDFKTTKVANYINNAAKRILGAYGQEENDRVEVKG